MELARIGATPAGGVCRLALTDEEIAARHLLISWAKELELDVFTDDISNLFFRLEGANPKLPPIVTGSHIDTQPTGGKFDGAFGVVAGFEAVNAIRDTDIALERSIEIVAWLNEEGSRFSPGMMGSEAFAKRKSLEEILRVTDSEGVTTEEALAKTIAEFPDLPSRPLGFPVASYIEAHIEQAPNLERAGIPVGVVIGIQGSRRFRVRVEGDEGHAGTLPMAERRDALFAANEIIAALRHAFAIDDLKFTIGLFDVSPNAPSVVPANVLFSIDLRHPDIATLRNSGDAVTEICESNRGPCSVTVTEIASDDSLEFPRAVRDSITAAAEALDIASMPILSLAGHDARPLHYHCESGMIFAPCEGGISHHEAENAEPSDLAAATRVLAATIAGMADAASG